MPEGCETNITTWWRSLDDLAVVYVCLPHERHGNAGRRSNSAKTSVREDFLLFVDMGEVQIHMDPPGTLFLNSVLYRPQRKMLVIMNSVYANQ